LLHTARTLGRDYDAAMDAYAYVLEQLRHDDFHRLRAYVHDSRSSFPAWLTVVARRLCLDHLRQLYGREQGGGSRSRDARAVRRTLLDHLAEQLDASDLMDQDSANDPEMRLRAAELSGAITETLGRLEPSDQLLLKLRFEFELSAREIGQVMRFPTPFHVYRRLNMLVKQLRAALNQRGIKGPEP
jgi:RNA polymerase sigma factor (sigma-70 family)